MHKRGLYFWTDKIKTLILIKEAKFSILLFILSLMKKIIQKFLRSLKNRYSCTSKEEK